MGLVHAQEEHDELGHDVLEHDEQVHDVQEHDEQLLDDVEEDDLLQDHAPASEAAVRPLVHTAMDLCCVNSPGCSVRTSSAPDLTYLAYLHLPWSPRR